VDDWAEERQANVSLGAVDGYGNVRVLARTVVCGWPQTPCSRHCRCRRLFLRHYNLPPMFRDKHGFLSQPVYHIIVSNLARPFHLSLQPGCVSGAEAEGPRCPGTHPRAHNDEQRFPMQGHPNLVSEFLHTVQAVFNVESVFTRERNLTSLSLLFPIFLLLLAYHQYPSIIESKFLPYLNHSFALSFALRFVILSWLRGGSERPTANVRGGTAPWVPLKKADVLHSSIRLPRYSTSQISANRGDNENNCWMKSW
jgi:hypothetical protein